MTKIDLKILEEIVLKNLQNCGVEIQRVFHGRGNFYDDFSYLTVDSLNEIFFAVFYEENEKEKDIIETLKKIANIKGFKNWHMGC